MTPAEVRFAADGMLQSLATWLRLLGYDCLASPNQSGRRLLEQAVLEDRVFLTRNAHLTDNLPQALLERGRIAHIVGEHLPDQLRQVVRTFSLATGPYAVAYAAAGRFADAIATGQRAIELAYTAGQPQLAKEIETRLELYRNGRAYRQVRSPPIDETRPSSEQTRAAAHDS